MSRRLHATHTGGCGRCRGLGTTLRGGMVTYRPACPVKGASVMQRNATRSPSSHIARFCSGLDEEPAELSLRRRFAGAELDAAVGDEVEHGDPLRDPRRVVERWRGLDDAVAEAQVAGALRDRGEEHLGRARVRVLLEEVVLDLPDVVDPELVGELALLERVLEQLVLESSCPRGAGAGARRTGRTARRRVGRLRRGRGGAPSGGREPGRPPARRCGRASTSASCSALSTARSDVRPTSS